MRPGYDGFDLCREPLIGRHGDRSTPIKGEPRNKKQEYFGGAGGIHGVVGLGTVLDGQDRDALVA